MPDGGQKGYSISRVATLPDAAVGSHTARSGSLPEMTGDRRVSLWAQGGLSVDAILRADGSLCFAGQDLKPAMPGVDEYEYWITVAAQDVTSLVNALGGKSGEDVLALVSAHGEAIVRTGERAWVRSLGIEPEFASWSH